MSVRDQVGEGTCEKQCALMEQRDVGGEGERMSHFSLQTARKKLRSEQHFWSSTASLKSKRVDMYPDPSTLRRLLQGKWAKVSVGLQTCVGL